MKNTEAVNKLEDHYAGRVNITIDEWKDLVEKVRKENLPKVLKQRIFKNQTIPSSSMIRPTCN